MTNLQLLIEKAENDPAEFAMFLDRLSDDTSFFYKVVYPECDNCEESCYNCPRGRMRPLDWLNAEDTGDIQTLIDEYRQVQSKPPLIL